MNRLISVRDRSTHTRGFWTYWIYYGRSEGTRQRLHLHLQATHLLKRLLQDVSVQKTEGLFAFSVVVLDNDREQSAKQGGRVRESIVY